MTANIPTYEQRIAWFHEARFGLFIHWGVYSLLKRGEWVQHVERIPWEQYTPLAQEFNPEKYDPNQWAELAAAAGMKYMVLTSRHHDGFCLFDSKVSDFTAPKTGAKRDLVAEYVQAVRRAGLRVGLYYSLGDWRFTDRPGSWDVAPEKRDALVGQAHAQVRELMTNYGKIDVLWYDGAHAPADYPGGTAAYWDAAKLNAMVRSLQPDILINNRSGLGEDLDTPEQHVKASQAGRGWESCMTMDALWWGYFEHAMDWKTVPQLVSNLVLAASGAGNYLLNVGPKPDGTIREEETTRLLAMGKWLEKNGEAIYGCTRAPFSDWHLGPTTMKGDCVYWCMIRYPGPETVLPPLGKCKVTAASLLTTGRKLTLHDEGTRVRLTGLPESPPDPNCVVVKLRLGE